MTPRPPAAVKNWVGFTVGRVNDRSVFERKTTRSSSPDLVLSPARDGWVELRIVWIGPSFVLLRRYPGGAWVRHWTYWRSDLPRALHAGVDALSGYVSERADLVSRVDYMRFATTGIPPKLRTSYLRGKTPVKKLMPYLTR